MTRSATDYTSKYGPVLTPAVLDGVKATSCILDGEVVGFDPEYEVSAGDIVGSSLSRSCQSPYTSII